MLRLIYYQFKYSYRSWLGTVPLLLVASLVVGTSFIGIKSASASAVTSVQLFQMLIFFGGLTLFFLVSNITQLLLDQFKQDFQLWTILGANRSQLAFLLAGQLFLISLLTSGIGTLLSLVSVNSYYHWLQGLVGHRDLPDLVVRADVPTLLISLLTVPVITFVGGYYYSRRLLQRRGLSAQTSKRSVWFRRIQRAAVLAVAILLWLGCMTLLYADVSEKSVGERLNQTGVILFLLLVHLLMIHLFTPHLQLVLLKGLSHLFPVANYAWVMAKWNVLFKETYLKTLQSSLTMGVTLISGFLLYIQNTYLGSADQATQEVTFSFLAYLSAPILLILASLLSTTILSSYNEQKDLQQLRVLGVSNRQVLLVRLCEGLIQMVLVSLVSLLFNGLIVVAVSHGVAILGRHMQVYSGPWLTMLVVLPLFLVFYLGVKASLLLTSKP